MFTDPFLINFGKITKDTGVANPKTTPIWVVLHYLYDFRVFELAKVEYPTPKIHVLQVNFGLRWCEKKSPPQITLRKRFPMRWHFQNAITRLKILKIQLCHHFFVMWVPTTQISKNDHFPASTGLSLRWFEKKIACPNNPAQTIACWLAISECHHMSKNIENSPLSSFFGGFGSENTQIEKWSFCS